MDQAYSNTNHNSHAHMELHSGCAPYTLYEQSKAEPDVTVLMSTTSATPRKSQNSNHRSSPKCHKTMKPSGVLCATADPQPLN